MLGLLGGCYAVPCGVAIHEVRPAPMHGSSTLGVAPKDRVVPSWVQLSTSSRCVFQGFGMAGPV